MKVEVKNNPKRKRPLDKRGLDQESSGEYQMFKW